MTDLEQGGVMTADGTGHTSTDAGGGKTKEKSYLGITHPWWLRELASLATLVLAVLIIRSSIFSIYVIPTGSMLPTIKIDDRVFANKLAYGLMLPFSKEQVISWSAPKRGDIVLFKSPREDLTFVKRVVGIGGDKLHFENGVLHINGESAQEELQSDRSVMTDMGANEALARDWQLFVEKIADKPAHYILRANNGQTVGERRTFTVPEGKVFFVGDNRDGSNDSRSWGVVPETTIYGRASFVLYSTERHEGVLPKFRTDRFFASLEM